MIAVEGSKLSQRLKATVPDVITNLNTQESRHLSGNGMMLAQVLAWILYTQSNCIRREVLLRIMMPTPALDANSCAAPASETHSAQASDTDKDGAKPAPSSPSKVEPTAPASEAHGAHASDTDKDGANPARSSPSKVEPDA